MKVPCGTVVHIGEERKELRRSGRRADSCGFFVTSRREKSCRSCGHGAQRCCAPTRARKNAGRSKDRPLHEGENNRLVRATEGKEILRAFDRFLEAAEKLLEVLAAFDEIDFRGVYDKKIGAFIVEKEMLVGTGDFLDVLR